MSAIERPVLRYFGGKYVLAPWIISLLPKHQIYIEPYGGAASVLMRKQAVYHDVYNDLNSEIVNVFRVLRDAKLSRRLRKALIFTPFARDEYLGAFTPSDCPVESARRTVIKSFMGFGGDSCSAGKPTGFRSISLTTKRGTTPPTEWVSYWDAIPHFHERLRSVAIENRQASELMKIHDSPEALFFLDPPYVHDTRGTKHGYHYEMSDAQHIELVTMLSEIKGMVVLSGYENGIYENLGWKCFQKNTFADGARERTESLWLNPAAVAAMPQADLFSGGVA